MSDIYVPYVHNPAITKKTKQKKRVAEDFMYSTKGE